MIPAMLRTHAGVRGALLRFTSTKVNVEELTEGQVEEVRPHSEIPGPRVYPLFGSLPSLMMDKTIPNDQTQMHKMWALLMERYGPIVKVVTPGNAPFVAVMSPEDTDKLNRITMDEPRRTPLFSLKKLRDDWTDDYFQKRGGLLTENGDEWWRVRSRVQTAVLKPMVVSQYLTEMDDITLTFMDRIKELQDQHGEMPEDFQEELYKWALESVGVVALDRRFGCLGAPKGSPEAQQGEELINVVNSLFAALATTEMRMQLWRLFPTPSYKKLRENHGKLLKLIEQNMAETVALLQQDKDDSGRQHSVIQTLLSRSGITQKDVLTFIMDLVFAGIDTTSHTMAFCLYLLARNPEAQKKLQEEVDEVTAGLQGPLTSQHLARLSYTKAVIKETFRMFPLVFAFVRELTQDAVFQGYKIPAGYNMLSLNSLLGRDSSVFPRADEFLPERWQRDRPLGYIHPYASIPFGVGPRMCVGRRVAEQEMYTLLTRVAQRFTVEYHHEDLEQLSSLILYPSRPLKFSFVSR